MKNKEVKYLNEKREERKFEEHGNTLREDGNLPCKNSEVVI